MASIPKKYLSDIAFQLNTSGISCNSTHRITAGGLQYKPLGTDYVLDLSLLRLELIAPVPYIGEVVFPCHFYKKGERDV